MKQNPRMKFIEIDYPTLVKSPDEPIAKIAEFLGPELLPHADKMRAVIDGSLYRKRGKPGRPGLARNRRKRRRGI